MMAYIAELSRTAATQVHILGEEGQKDISREELYLAHRASEEDSRLAQQYYSMNWLFEEESSAAARTEVRKSITVGRGPPPGSVGGSGGEERSRVMYLGLDRLRRLRDGWMGEDSLAPDRATLADAQVFLLLARRHSLPGPTISASASGAISFSWRGPGGKATVRFEGDGFFGYALYKNGRYHAGLRDGSLESDMLPDELVTYLQEIGRA